MKSRALFKYHLVSLLFALLLLLSLLPAEGKVIFVEKDFTVKELPDSVGQGFEPHILAGEGIDGKQWYYVDSPTGLGNTQGGNLWISKDYGESWQWYDKDTVLGTSGDSYTATSKDGVIYYTDLYLSTASVDFSLDGGETWIANPLASEYVIVDRQWLVVGPNSVGAENLYFAFNQLAVGLVMVKSQLISTTGGALDWVPCNNGLPISSDVASRDNFAVDQNNGNIYIANYQSNGIFCYISKDEGESFTGVKVFDETEHAKVQNTFIQIDVDTAGNVYMMWSSRDHIMLAVSQDEGSSWDVKQVTESPGTRVLPWIAAGDPGRIAMAWYETPDVGNPNNLDDSIWDFVVATTINALDKEPTYEITVVDPMAHVGSVRTSGLDGDEGPPPDRDLGDFISVDIDELGRAIVAFGHDGDDGPNARQAVCMFARQNEGPFLFKDVGPLAEFTFKISGLKIKVDASTSVDLNGKGIVNYTWDWGDNTTTSTGKVAEHNYKKAGIYNVTLKVENQDGQIIKKTILIKVEEEKEFNYLPFAVSALLILLALASAYLFKKKKQRK